MKITHLLKVINKYNIIDKIAKLLGYLWIGIWGISTIIILYLEVYACIKFYPEIVTRGFAEILVFIFLGIVMFGVIAVLGYLILLIILGISLNDFREN